MSFCDLFHFNFEKYISSIFLAKSTAVFANIWLVTFKDMPSKPISVETVGKAQTKDCAIFPFIPAIINHNYFRTT